MKQRNLTIEQQLVELKIPGILEGGVSFGVKKTISSRAIRALIPMADGADFNLPIVQEWYKMIMPTLQKEGWHFHEAFARASNLWNNSAYALEYGFRLPYQFGTHKHYKGGKRLNPNSILHILSIRDNKDDHIAQAMDIPLEELWPEQINGNNQFTPRRSDPGAYDLFWGTYGGREKFRELQAESRDTRRSLSRALQWFNQRKGMPFQVQSDMSQHPVVLSLLQDLIARGEVVEIRPRKK